MKRFFVCVLAVTLVVTFAVPAVAADWAFYGSARMATFSNDVDPQTPGSTSDTDTTWDLQANSRIGAKVSGGDVGGRFEYGSGPNLRLLYGTWNFGAGTLIVGQDYTPLNELGSKQVWGDDNGLKKEGMTYHSRRGQIKLRFGGFDLAFVTPNPQATLLDTVGATVTSADNDTTLPQIAMAYKFSSDRFSVKPYLGWATYDFTTCVTSATQQESVDSLVYGVSGKVNYGPAYFLANLFAGSNIGNMGIGTRTLSNAVINAANGKIVDNDSLAYAAIVGFKANDMFTIEGGYGHISSEVDVLGVKTEDTAFSYYINTTITLAPGVIIVPEIGIQSNDELKSGGVTTKQSETTYFGAKWQISF
jgi:hypothetical protein